MPNIYGMCQCLCLVEEREDPYAKHDRIRKQSFERDTHVGDGSLEIGMRFPGVLQDSVLLYCMRR